MIVIVGGGATGVIFAAHLLKNSRADRIVLVEKRGRIGRGLAYSTTLPDHLLNVRAQNMSALPDDPDHFVRWLTGRNLMKPEAQFFFAPRKTYGDYLEDLLREADAEHPGRLQIVGDEVIWANPYSSGVEVHLASGETLQASRLVLATGHDIEPLNRDQITVRIDSQDSALPSDAPVLILGSGLSMVDAVLSLEARGHRGAVTVVSRRGLVPQRQVLPHPIPFTQDDLPFGVEPSRFLRWLRDGVRAHVDVGGNWRDVIDGLRPYNQRIWQSWPERSRKTFLRHAKAWWDTHRHRMAPEVHDRIQAAMQAGRLIIRAARVLRMEKTGAGVAATLRPRGSRQEETLQVARVYECTGIIRNIEDSSHAILRGLVQAGLAKADPLRLSLQVTRDCHLIGQDGQVSQRLYALGPLTRSEFFEIDAIPEIRVQAAMLAKNFS